MGGHSLVTFVHGAAHVLLHDVTFSDLSGLIKCYGQQEGDLCPGNQSGPWAPSDDDAREDYFGDGNGNRNPDNSHTGKPGSKPPSTFQDYPTYPNGVRIQVTDEAVIIYIPATAPYYLPPGADPYAVAAAVDKLLGTGFKNPQGRHTHLPAPHIVGIACEEIATPGTCGGGFREALSADYLTAISSKDPTATVGTAQPASGPSGGSGMDLLGMVAPGGVGGAGKARMACPCRKFGFANAPKVPGVYVMTFKDGRVYVGASQKDIHSRVHAAFTDPQHAVYKAGYRLQYRCE